MADTWVLLRGLIREQRHWETFPELLREQNPGKQIVTIDVAGAGERHQETSPASINGLMESIRWGLAQRDIQPPYNLVAISMGGMMGLEWLVEHPSEIHRAVLMNTSLRAFNPVYERLRPQNYPAIFNNVLLSRDRYSREKTILDITSNLRQDKVAVAKRWAGYAQDRPISRTNALRQLAASARYSAPRQAPHNRILILNGAKDRLVDANCSIQLARNWQLPFLQHAEAGHDLTLDASAWVATHVQDFFT